MVGVSSMINVEHVEDVIRVVDAITDAVLATSRAPLAHERRTQRSANPEWILGQRSEQELNARRGNGFGEVFGQLPCGRPGHDDPEAH